MDQSQVTDIRSLLAQERDLWKQLGCGGWLEKEFMLRNGKLFTSQPLPKRFKMRMPKACFYNSARLVRTSPRLRYCEGYVHANLPILIHHAWCVDPEDRVVDVTLQNFHTGQSESGSAQYFGLVFPRGFLPSRPGESMLLNRIGEFRTDLWLELDPDFRPILEAGPSLPGVSHSVGK